MNILNSFLNTLGDKDFESYLEEGVWPQKQTSSPQIHIDRSQLSYKALGGKALIGTPKQKKWAEEIREKALHILTKPIVKIVLSAKEFSHAKVWIENRDNFDAITNLAINVQRKIDETKNKEPQNEVITVYVRVNPLKPMLTEHKEMYKVFGKKLNQKSFKKFELTEEELKEFMKRMELTGDRFEFKYS